MPIQLKRAYTPAADADGYRVLVDRLWPRGVSKQAARIDLWLKDAAPRTALRQWFDHEAEKWDEFKRRYYLELESQPDAIRQLATLAKQQSITLVYGARNQEFNQAVALKAYLETLPDREQ